MKTVPEGTSNLTVCADHYHHYKEDIALMAEMGFQSYQFSISWSRILPEGNKRVNPQRIEFARILFENFGDRVKYWLTINEQILKESM